ncbi:hypothetical protein GCM10020001_032730 [Nonomuraea salmonea]
MPDSVTFSAPPVDDELAERDAVGRGRLRPAQHGADAGVEHARLDRLDHVVVGAGLEAHHDVEVVASCGEQDDGELVELADAAAHLDAVDAGEHDVEDRDLRAAGSDVVERLLTRRVRRDGVSLPGQRQLQSRAHRGIVFYKEDASHAHIIIPCPDYPGCVTEL